MLGSQKENPRPPQTASRAEAAGAVPDSTATATFLRDLYGDAPLVGAAIVTWALPTRATELSTTVDGAAARCTRRAKREDVYTGCAAVRADLASGRGTVDDVRLVAGLMVDLDVKGPGRKKPDLFKSIDECRAFLATLPLQPTLVVNSGGGLQAWWLFHERVATPDDAARERLTTISRGWSEYVREQARLIERSVDATFDLTRVARVPGTFNRKYGEPRLVTIESREPLRRYAPDDLAPFAAPARKENAPPPPATPAAPLVLTASAKPPADKLTALLDADPKFRASMARNRPDLGDQSPSGYDLSLASIAARAGWSDQEITDLLIAHRREHGDDLHLDNPGKFKRTIGKARVDSDADSTAPKKGNAAPRRIVALFDAAHGEVVVDSTGGRFAAVPTGPRLDVLEADGFRGWLAREADLPSETQVRNAAFAILSREPRRAEVFLRVGWSADRTTVWLDLGDETGAAVEINAAGWRVVPRPGVLFRRSGAERALPRPTAGGDLREIEALIGLRDEALVLVVAWLVGALAPGGGYPVLAIGGAQGCGKSTLARLLKSIVDPTGAPLRALPRDDRDLAVAARGSHVLGFDNVSAISAVLADGLCRIATGDGFAARKLYSDSTLVVMEAARPVLFTSISEQPLARADLGDRSIAVTLPPRAMFRPDDEIVAAIEAARPRLLGAVLTACAAALANLQRVDVALPRMASFARWIVAAELGGALPWKAGTFLAAYGDNRQEVAAAGLDGDPLAAAIASRLEQSPDPIVGSAAELLPMLGGGIAPGGDFPTTASGVGERLARLAPSLLAVGIRATRAKGSKGRRVWTITRVVEAGGAA